MSTTAPPFSTPSRASGREELLERIDARLERIETRLAKLDPLLDAAPGLVAMAGDTFDELSAEIGDLDQRLRSALRLLERATRPDTLTQLESLLDMFDAAPGLVAMVGDSVDELVSHSASRGLPLERLIPDLGRALEAALRLISEPRVQQLLESDLLLPEAIDALTTATRALAASHRAAQPKLGLLGALSAMREPAVQSAVGFAIDVARRFGTNITTSTSTSALSTTHE